MKFTKFLFAGAFAAGIGAASLHATECNVTHHQGGGGSTDVYMGYPATALYLFEGDYLDLSKMSQREPAVKNASSTDTAWVYRSTLDSTMIVIVTEKVVKVARVTYSEDENSRMDSLFTVNHKDVYKDEFPRLQKAGVFKGTAEQADSLVTHVFELCQKFYSKDYGYGGCVFNPPEQRGRNGRKDVDMVDMPLALATVAGEFTILLDTLNTCPDIKFPPESTTASPAIPGLSQAWFSFKKLGQNRYQIAGAKPNSPYKAFSLNGQFLKGGFLEGNVFVAPALPVILMLSDEQRIYLK
ncbi:hypothetical protein SAMN05720761_12328 [Fibrobacter sp. UWCM]|uniref:hypothetical protein n=1 Tax=Fibrobacter sp. UWCM TaxID=1896208 RepID=UPI000918D3C3|nr:hypothetical protein [Fibrobacter sp. UWCM]SHH71471.1 hypothetical protein SAMN05720761_12328 [Fibrobacter sp. UWCM]